VVIVFEGGDLAKPIIVAGINKKPSSSHSFSGSGDTTLDWSPRSTDTELPEEVRGSRTGNLIYKSPKGAMIFVDEDDGGEILRIVDRSGQEILLESPVSAGSSGNSDPREDGRLDPGDVVKGRMELVNLHDDKIKMFFDGSSRYIYIEDGEAKNFIRIDIQNGNMSILVDNDKTENVGNNKSVQVGADLSEVVGGSKSTQVTGTLTIAATGKVTVYSAAQVDVDAPIITLN
jgi:hypothetical protein